MKPEEDLLIFMFDDSPVGYFETSEYPTKDGDYQYMAFRGHGHYEMQLKLRESGKAHCYFDVDEKRIEFDVVKSNKSFLTLTNFIYQD
jgi:hypothetical protein